MRCARISVAGIVLIGGVAGALPWPEAGSPASAQSASEEKSTTFDAVRHVIVAQLKIDPNKVTRGARIMADLGADSLDSVEIVIAAETRFNVELTDEECARVTTVGNLIQLIDEKLLAGAH